MITILKREIWLKNLTITRIIIKIYLTKRRITVKITNINSHLNQVELIMKLNEFFSQNEVFTLDELKTFLSQKGNNNSNTRNSLLLYYQKQGRLLRVRRELYAVIPLGNSLETFPVDPFLLTSKMTKDSVLAYHTALSFHGKVYSFNNHQYYLTGSKSQPLSFQNYRYIGVSIPKSLIKSGKEMYGVSSHSLYGTTIKVTTF